MFSPYKYVILIMLLPKIIVVAELKRNDPQKSPCNTRHTDPYIFVLVDCKFHVSNNIFDEASLWPKHRNTFPSSQNAYSMKNRVSN